MPRVHAAGVDFGVCWGTAINASLPELIGAAAAAGFGSITVSNALLASAYASGLTDSDLHALLDEAGVTVAYIDPLLAGLPGACPIEQVPVALRRYFDFGQEQVLAAAVSLRAPAINIAHFLGDPATPIADLTETIAGVARRAGRFGIAVLVEFIPGTAIGDLGAAAAIIAACGEKNVRMTLDTWHLARSGGTVAQIEKLPAGTIAGLQVSDWTPPPPGAPFVMMTGRRMPGTGALPLAEIIGASLRNNPSLLAMVEVLDSERAKRPAAAILRETAAAIAEFGASAVRRIL